MFERQVPTGVQKLLASLCVVLIVCIHTWALPSARQGREPPRRFPRLHHPVRRRDRTRRGIAVVRTQVRQMIAGRTLQPAHLPENTRRELFSGSTNVGWRRIYMLHTVEQLQ